MLLGVYGSREAAFEAIKAEPNMTAYVDDKEHVRGRPVKEREPLRGPWFPTRWAHGWPEQVKSRSPVAATIRPGTAAP
jgi:hypothetical protein